MPQQLQVVNHSPFPEWHHQPLQLTMEEMANPVSIIHHFFDTFTLPEIRIALKEWFRASLTARSAEAKNRLFTYEEIEKLVEATWVMHQQEIKNTHLTADHSHKRILGTTSEKKDKLNKHNFIRPARLIEEVATNPLAVIREVLKDNSLVELCNHILPDWISIAMLNDEKYYPSREERARLVAFCDDIKVLLSALYIIAENKETTIENQGIATAYKAGVRLTKEQMADPISIVTAFCERFTIEYVRRELWCFLDTGVGYDGSYPDSFSPWIALMAYDEILCLVESAYVLNRR